jgi:LPXTG-motif cell wall-anchored protein/uncharacterized repeat protein (TIGR01451 family)
MKKTLSFSLLFTFMVALIPISAFAAPKLQVQLTAFNITQNKDATTVKNHPGDVIRYTTNVKNLGPEDLVDYEMNIYIKDIMKYATMIDLGGGVIEGDYIKYPPILQAFDCNCSNANYFKVKLKDNVCEVPTLSAKYEDVTTTIPIECIIPPRPPKTGTEMIIIIVAALLVAGGSFAFARRKV